MTRPACGRAARSSAASASTSASRGAAGDGAFAGALDDGAVGEWIAEGHAEFDHVGAGVDGGQRDLAGGREVGVAGGEVDDEAGLVGEADRHRCSSPMRPCSLQFAGEDAHVLVAAAGEVDHEDVVRAILGARRMASATACALSSAGMMPSVRARRRRWRRAPRRRWRRCIRRGRSRGARRVRGRRRRSRGQRRRSG